MEGHSHDHDHRDGDGDGHESHGHGGEHGHAHGLVDRSIMRSRAGLRAVGLSLGILGITALVQLAIFVVTGSVALLADLVHNFGDAATAIPVGVAFLLRSFRAERIAGLFVVFAIFVSACVALGFDLADPIVGLAVTLVILRITLDSWRTVRTAEPGNFGSVA